MTNTEKAIARYVRIGGVEHEGRAIIADAIKVCPARGYMMATLMQFQMATAATVERMADAIIEEARA